MLPLDASFFVFEAPLMANELGLMLQFWKERPDVDTDALELLAQLSLRTTGNNEGIKKGLSCWGPKRCLPAPITLAFAH